MDFLEAFRFQGASTGPAVSAPEETRQKRKDLPEETGAGKAKKAKQQRTQCFVHTSPAQLVHQIQPFIAPAADGGWRERFSSCCSSCFLEAVCCPHFEEVPLRLLLIGHNPSEHSYSSGLPYSNPSNRFYHLLRLAKIVPTSFLAKDANRMPAELGIGVTDLGLEAGSDANEYGKPIMRKWAACLRRRLSAHLHRAGGVPPAIVAFTGKRQFSVLWEGAKSAAEIAALPFGKQTEVPPNWPFRGDCSELWLLRSSSGRAAMTTEERNAPYEQLGRRLAQMNEQNERSGHASPKVEPHDQDGKTTSGAK
jgi:TDG/mug DNA glycosylase family protein